MTTEKLLAAVLAATPDKHAAILRAATVETGRPKLVTRKAAAEVVGVHPRTLERYARRGLIHERRVSSRLIRVDLGEVQRLFELGADAALGRTDDEHLASRGAGREVRHA